MRNLKYLFIAFFAFAAISCSEESILRDNPGDEDDDPIVNPPPPPPPVVPLLDTLQLSQLKRK